MDYFIRECTNPALPALSKACPAGLPAFTPQLSLPFDDETSFNTWFLAFLQSEKGQEYLKAQDLGIDSKTFRLKYMRVSAQSEGISTSARKEKIPIREGWDKYVKDFSENPATPEGLRIVYQEANVFWAWMESE